MDSKAILLYFLDIYFPEGVFDVLVLPLLLALGEDRSNSTFFVCEKTRSSREPHGYLKHVGLWPKVHQGTLLTMRVKLKKTTRFGETIVTLLCSPWALTGPQEGGVT